MFAKGDIIHFNFKEYNPDQHPQYTIKGPHYAVVLFDAGDVNQTITIAPITSLYNKQGQKKRLKAWDMELDRHEEYNPEKPCFIKLDQIHTVDRQEIELCEKKWPLDTEKDIPRLDICLITVFQLYYAVEKMAAFKLKAISETLLLDKFDKNILQDIKKHTSEVIPTQINEIISEHLRELDINQDIKGLLKKELCKEELYSDDRLIDKISDILKNILFSLFDKR